MTAPTEEQMEFLRDNSKAAHLCNQLDCSACEMDGITLALLDDYVRLRAANAKLSETAIWERDAAAVVINRLIGKRERLIEAGDKLAEEVEQHTKDEDSPFGVAVAAWRAAVEEAIK